MQRSNSADSWWCHSPNSIRPTNTTARFSLTPLPSFPLFSFLSSLFDRGYPRDQQPLIDTPIEDADRTILSSFRCSSILGGASSTRRFVYRILRPVSIGFFPSVSSSRSIDSRGLANLRTIDRRAVIKERERNVRFQFSSIPLSMILFAGWTGRGDERASIPCQVTLDSIGLNR